jgi:Aspartyl protease/PDZ domain
LKQRLAIILFFCFLSGFIHAQEEFIEPPARRLTRFSFTQLSGGVVMLHARLDDFPDTLNFIFDTGSSGISLDSSTVDYFGLKPEPTERTIRGIAGIKKVSFLYNRKLRLEGLTVDSLNFHINDYSVLTSVYGEKVDGIIGYAVLSRYIVKIDYDLYTMEFWTKGTIRYPKGGYLFKPNITTLPVQMARARDAITVNTRFLYDIGAALCLLLTKDFVNDSSFLDKKRKLFVKEAEGVGGKVDMNITVVKELKLGPYKFRNVPTYVFDDVNNITSYPYLGGLIGNDILRRFNTTFNYAKEEFYLMPNTHYSDGFDYAYTGVELYFVDGNIIAGDVASGSPAEQCGLREGDVIIGINRNFSQNLTAMKQALQVVNEKIKIVVRRDGQLLEMEFKAKSLLGK